jgi:5-methylcytosine-specific restriction protein A
MPKRIPYHRPKGRPTRKEMNREYDRKRDDEIRALYRTPRWRALRLLILARDPFCIRCLSKSPPIRTPSTVANHIKKARDFPELFFEETNLEGDCKPCHDSEIQSEERKANGRKG